MKKLILLFICSFALGFINAQGWNQVGSIPNSPRYDDICFLTNEIGWAVNSRGEIYKTTDGGEQWEEKFNSSYYLRAIDFVDENIGYVGTLDNVLLQTVDGGETWIEIQDRIDNFNTSICGLSHAGNNVYGVGFWGYPAYFIKSKDGGETWTHQDLSEFADGLVECHFLDENVGFIGGIDQDSGGVILKTTDGGESWNRIYTTDQGAEYIWKLDFVTENIIYGAVENMSGRPGTIVKSEDAGDSWTIHEVDSIYLDLQGIGFLDENIGWVGPRNNPMYQTNDGGLSWERKNNLPNNINRIIRLESGFLNASGSRFYTYRDSLLSSTDLNVSNEEVHSFSLFPNPVIDHFNLNVNLGTSTTIRLDIFDQNGRLVNHIFHGRSPKGPHKFVVNLEDIEITSGVYFLSLRTNEGFSIKKFIVTQ